MVRVRAKAEELTEMKWVMRELAMDDGLFESKPDQFPEGTEEAVASLSVFQI